MVVEFHEQTHDVFLRYSIAWTRRKHVVNQCFQLFDTPLLATWVTFWPSVIRDLQISYASGNRCHIQRADNATFTLTDQELAWDVLIFVFWRLVTGSDWLALLIWNYMWWLFTRYHGLQLIKVNVIAPSQQTAHVIQASEVFDTPYRKERGSFWVTPLVSRSFLHLSSWLHHETLAQASYKHSGRYQVNWLTAFAGWQRWRSRQLAVTMARGTLFSKALWSTPNRMTVTAFGFQITTGKRRTDLVVNKRPYPWQKKKRVNLQTCMCNHVVTGSGNSACDDEENLEADVLKHPNTR